MNLESIQWTARFPALVPRLAVAREEKALVLAKLLRGRPEQMLNQLRGACYKNFFFVLGESEHLPWIDGIEYLGVCPSSPGLYVPVNLRPGLDESIYGRVIKNHFQEKSEALGIGVNPLFVFSLASSKELSARAMEAIITIIEGQNQ